MPLPPALAKRLALRGVIQPKATPKPSVGDLVEEVIAESYDDKGVMSDGATALQKRLLGLQPLPDPEVSKFHRMGHSGCPNKSNQYHVCSQFCVTFWGRGRRETPSGYNAKRLAMLKKYPLPAGWVEVYESGIARHYYWNMDTGNVCWLSPSHPKAEVLRPASELRGNILKKQLQEKAAAARNKDLMPPPPGVGAGAGLTGTSGSKRAERDEDSREGKKRRLREAKDDLDPMDPAAYSDIPRGTWKAGLVEGDDAKSGVDSTATGPLFQMRPYPSPGYILRANAEKKKGSSS